jgi:hypothetical protein
MFGQTKIKGIVLKITIARLRSSVQYTKPLEHIMDSFYHLYEKFVYSHKEYDYGYYNFSWGGANKPKRNLDEIKSADVILIPSENEFHYHVPNYIHPFNLEKSNKHIEDMKPFLEGKHIIIMSSDNADNVELYKNFTFSGVNFSSIQSINENDFPKNIHTLKYKFIRDKLEFLSDMGENVYNKKYDFCYWGTDKRKLAGGIKSSDTRHQLFKKISKEDINSFWIGRFSNIKRDMKFSKMRDIIVPLSNSFSTICYNWIDQTKITSRYLEAVACKMIPLVANNYDQDNQLGISDWQRCETEEDVIEKIYYIKENYNELFEEVEKNFLRNLPSEDEHMKSFEFLLKNKVEVLKHVK